ncbi:MAG TPA: hypothetical protein EYO18_04825, partial [Candidatus Marinimicrobia bacterium]|nr:hypothetical protein [Candidatus Neomarinimicrobiota bacterium]
DLSENGNNFSLYDAASWNTDVPEETTTSTNTHSLSFDGEDDLVSFQNAVIPMTGDVSVQVWAYAEENNGYSNMVTQGDPTVGAYFISYESDDQMRISHEWSDINVTYPFGVWVQITVVKNDDGTKLYFDGQLVAETTEIVYCNRITEKTFIF